MTSVLARDNSEWPTLKRPGAELYSTAAYETAHCEAEPTVPVDKLRLEFGSQGEPTIDPLLEAHKRSVDQDDEAFARGEFDPPTRDFCSYLIRSIGLQIEAVRQHVLEMSDAEIERYQDAIQGLARSADLLNAAIFHVQKMRAKRDAIRTGMHK